MQLLGYLIQHIKATDPNEPLWSNTCHGNRHQRIVSLERVIAKDGLVAFALYVGQHQIRWAKLSQTPGAAKKTKKA